MNRGMDTQKLFQACDIFSTATGVELLIINNNAETLYRTLDFSNNTMFCDGFCNVKVGDNKCSMSRLYGSYQAQRFGGRYIYFCNMGLMHFVFPITREGVMSASIVSCPILLMERDEYLQEEIMQRFSIVDDEIEQVGEFLKKIPIFAPSKVHALSELLFYTMNQFCDGRISDFESVNENQKLQSIISEYIQSMKKNVESGFYPLDKEDELLDAMSNGDIKAAKALLNELLGHIFFYSGFKFEVIRSRVLELIVLISRAAVKGGANAELVFGMNFEYLRQIDKFDNLEDLTLWLSVIMNRFTNYVFNFVGVKHADIIYKAIEYIKTNYMNKISLDEVANYVYLSPTYFSKVFKDETKNNFNTYLNKIRIEQSKKLLLNNNINMSDISNLVGYEDQSYFSKVFKKSTGVSPLKFRQSRGIY